jgi:hypothetical protein
MRRSVQASAPRGAVAGRRLLLLTVLGTSLLLTASLSLALRPARAAPMVFTVTSTGTTNDNNCLASCTLWQAINAANLNPGADTIKFNLLAISDPPAFTIMVPNNSPLPDLSDSVTIDGTSQDGYVNAPVIEIRRSPIGLDQFAGLRIFGDSSAVKGLAIGGFNGDGITVQSNGNTITGNYIGTDLSGTSPVPNTGDGILISQSSNNVIGGTTAPERNVISGNGSGINLFLSGSTNNLIQGNYIGTNAQGTLAIANVGGGVLVSDGAGNTIGGTIGTDPGGCVGACNLISGNGGVNIAVASASGTQILGNYIGPDVNGTASLSPSATGINLGDGASNTTIGGSTAAARNLISGNGGAGIAAFGSNVGGTVIKGNYIGTTRTGTSALPNQGSFGGIRISSQASNITVGGGNPVDGNLISGNTANGIYSAAPNTFISSNYIGTNATGQSQLPNGGDGIRLNGAGASDIGGTTGTLLTACTGPCNLISGNQGHGVQILGVTASNNFVSGNFIGTNAAGSFAVPNGQSGIALADGAGTNSIGNPGAGYGNVVSGNNRGIEINGANGNLVRGNFIGTNAAGLQPIPNTTDGVLLTGNASNNTIGGAVPDTRNLISGNTGHGVELANGAQGNLIRGNYIGTNQAGTQALANGADGVHLSQAPANVIGGTTGVNLGNGCSGECNLISGNGANGIGIGSLSNGNAIQGNLIGTNVGGTGNLGNSQRGVAVQSSATSIGGVNSATANLIANNGSDGVGILSGANNVIRSNRIRNNGGLGISLVGGANNNQAAPTLTVATADGTNVLVAGTLTSTPSTTFLLEFFELTSPDPSGFGEGDALFASSPVSTDPLGHASFNFAMNGGGTVGHFISATATDPAGNTSQFSNSLVTVAGAVVTFTPTTTITQTATASATSTPSSTATRTRTPSSTSTATATGTRTATPAVTLTATITPTSNGQNVSSLNGQVQFQGRGNPPSASWQVPLSVRFFSGTTPTPVLAVTAVPDASGNFTVNNVPPGTYHVRVKPAQSLSRQANGVNFPAGIPVGHNFGQLPTGDTDNNDLIDIVDFSLLRSVFGSSITCGVSNPSMVPCADYNGDGQVDIVDFSLLRSNFGTTGPQPG